MNGPKNKINDSILSMMKDEWGAFIFQSLRAFLLGC